MQIRAVIRVRVSDRFSDIKHAIGVLTAAAKLLGRHSPEVTLLVEHDNEQEDEC